MTTHRLCIVFAVCAATCALANDVAYDDSRQTIAAQALQPASQPINETLEAQLIGTWVLAEASTPGSPSGIGIRRKIFSPGRWEIIQKDPRTGEVVFHHGGSYRINGDILEQKVEFAAVKTKNYIGQTRRFRIKIVGDTHLQIGLGNPFNEVWKRTEDA